MKLFSSISILVIAMAGISAAQENVVSVLRFSNGDRITGSLETLSADRLVWQSPLLHHSSPFFLKSIVDLTLPGKQSQVDANHEAIVSLTNGDRVLGTLASVTDNAISIETAFCGLLTFKRQNVSGLKVRECRKFSYRGPTGLDGWKISGTPTSWTYGRSAFFARSQGGIGKEDVLPDECSISFDATWKNEAFGLKVVIFAKDTSVMEPTSGYEISFQRGGFLVRNCNAQGGFLGNGQSQEFLENETVKIEIRASQKTGRLCMLVNDQMVDSWSDPDFKVAQFGDGLQFISVGSQPMRISNIIIAELDQGPDQIPDPLMGVGGMRGGMVMPRFGRAQIENDGKPTGDENKSTGNGRMKLSNGDSLEGEVIAIRDGVIEVKTPLGEIQLPVERLRDIKLKAADLETCIRRKGDIRASMPDGSSLVFRVDAVENGVISGSSQNFGNGKFKIDAMSRMEFNIYDPELEGKRASEEW